MSCWFAFEIVEVESPLDETKYKLNPSHIVQNNVVTWAWGMRDLHTKQQVLCEQ